MLYAFYAYQNSEIYTVIAYKSYYIKGRKEFYMINVFNFFNKVYEDLSDKNYNRDEDLIKYFKSEYGKEWKIELDKHLLKTEFDINKKAA